MADASDAVAVDEQPRREANPYSYIFFFVFVLFGSFFILNLIVGVIIESFQKLRKQVSFIFFGCFYYIYGSHH